MLSAWGPSPAVPLASSTSARLCGIKKSMLEDGGCVLVHVVVVPAVLPPDADPGHHDVGGRVDACPKHIAHVGRGAGHVVDLGQAERAAPRVQRRVPVRRNHGGSLGTAEARRAARGLRGPRPAAEAAEARPRRRAASWPSYLPFGAGSRGNPPAPSCRAAGRPRTRGTKPESPGVKRRVRVSGPASAGCGEHEAAASQVRGAPQLGWAQLQRARSRVAGRGQRRRRRRRRRAHLVSHPPSSRADCRFSQHGAADPPLAEPALEASPTAAAEGGRGVGRGRNWEGEPPAALTPAKSTASTAALVLREDGIRLPLPPAPPPPPGLPPPLALLSLPTSSPPPGAPELGTGSGVPGAAGDAPPSDRPAIPPRAAGAALTTADTPPSCADPVASAQRPCGAGANSGPSLAPTPSATAAPPGPAAPPPAAAPAVPPLAPWAEHGLSGPADASDDPLLACAP
eukprot:scaffold10943_cov102-Isochrysis_galbana.AAC.2